ncbi:thiamine-phosphate kinase [Methylococcus geothermalis]
MPDSMQRPGEFEIIRRFFSRQRVMHPETELGIGDDCAILNFAAETRLALTTDTLVAGVHFFPDADPMRLGHKALAVNLSDLAAMGARPRWALLALTLPENDPEWIAAFAQGFFGLAERHGVQLIGGDTTRGPLAITVQALGTAAGRSAVKRSGAQPGDAVYVTGGLGLAGLGLKIRQGAYDASDEEALDRLDVPEPRVGFGLRLPEFASACIDVSDGLAADLGHILEQSAVGAEVDWENLPLSAGVCRYVADSGDWEMPLVAGDDYELCFTAPAMKANAVTLAAEATGTRVSRIGTIRAGSGLSVRRAGRPERLWRSGYLHFVSRETTDESPPR